jgi:hypothetical protein
VSPSLRTGLRVAAFVTAGALLLAAAAPGMMREGPPTAHTGGFGEPTCHACHFQAPVGSGGGSLAVDGLPAAWEPGRSYELTVVLRHERLALGGFQLSARFDDGTQAGYLEPDDSLLVRVTPFRDVQYAHHTWAGAVPGGHHAAASGAGEVRWRLRWTAPAAGTGSVSWHAAANAADDDDSPLGDYVYAASVAVPASSTSAR